MKAKLLLGILSLTSMIVNAETPVTKPSTDIIMRTEGRNDVNQALSTSVDSSAKEARQEKLSNNAVIFRRNAIPAKMLLTSESGDFDSLPLATMVIETDELRDNDVFRDIFEGYSSDSKGVTYTTVLTRKDNWISGDKNIAVGDTKAAAAHTTVFQRLFPVTSGTGLVTGELFKKKTAEVACDVIDEDEKVTSRTLCIQDGAKMTIADTLGAWSKVNKASVIRVYFEHRNITIPTFKRYYQKVLGMKDLSISVVDSSNKELFKIAAEDLKLSFVRLDDRAGKPWASLTDLPDNDPNLFNMKVWVESKSFKLPCLSNNQSICEKDKDDHKEDNKDK